MIIIVVADWECTSVILACRFCLQSSNSPKEELEFALCAPQFYSSPHCCCITRPTEAAQLMVIRPLGRGAMWNSLGKQKGTVRSFWLHNKSDPPERRPFLHSLPSGHSRLLPSSALCLSAKGKF